MKYLVAITGRFNQRWLLVLIVLFQTGIQSRADGILGTVDSDAQEYFVNFVSSREDIPRSFVAVGFGESFAARDFGKRIVESELRFIDGQKNSSGPESCRYMAFALRKISQGMRTPIWDQTLICDGRRHLRRGYALKKGATNADEASDTPEEDSSTRRTFPSFDAFYLSFGDIGSYHLSRIEPNFGVNIYSEAKFQSARRDSDGKAVGIWTIGENNETGFEITFDNGPSHRPIQVLWSFSPKGLTDAEAKKTVGDITTVIKTEWKQIQMGDKIISLPVLVTRSHILPGKKGHTEYVYRIGWKQINDEFPNPQDEDWREVFRSAFDVDWSQHYLDVELN
ncbi:hypothetical protein U8335_23385 [Roseiconus lacunae]|uniref:hypothetical protein n=1 Tax=Roseiconus lacunae TaxID=2605694 RepID=UPI003085E893|nr:hypothetical protein U8335_23385 [Stieleria sp. HD01]